MSRRPREQNQRTVRSQAQGRPGDTRIRPGIGGWQVGRRCANPQIWGRRGSWGVSSVVSSQLVTGHPRDTHEDVPWAQRAETAAAPGLMAGMWEGRGLVQASPCPGLPGVPPPTDRSQVGSQMCQLPPRSHLAPHRQTPDGSLTAGLPAPEKGEPLAERKSVPQHLESASLSHTGRAMSQEVAKWP